MKGSARDSKPGPRDPKSGVAATRPPGYRVLQGAVNIMQKLLFNYHLCGEVYWFNSVIG